MARIAVIGAHGKIALHLLPLLAAEDHQVSAVVRNPDHVAEVQASGAKGVVADVETMDTAALTDLLEGHEAVVWTAGAGGGDPARTKAVDEEAAIRSMDAASAAGVRRYVMISYNGARPDHGVDPENPFWHYAEAKAAADEHLRSSDLDWTVLGPSRLTEGPPTGSIAVAPREEGSGEVSRANVARVVVEALESNATVGRTIEFHDGSTPIDDALR